MGHRAAIYCRVSTADQSCERQEFDLRAFAGRAGYDVVGIFKERHCCKVSDEAAFCLIQRPYISKTLLTRRISPRGSP
ncbi:recombinase family protein [Klebsiella quasipneumoniae]|uniref:recombinase family protein n=1 Tax=Klebsiella quasipneumoniae TaxID=1463165 RepID=UPI001865385E|nr:recombinase family protein [Klebsiella quasipneumoniae]